VLAYGMKVLGLKRIIAITSSDNHSSARLLEKLGLRYEGRVAYPDTGEEVRLFAIEIEQSQSFS
jgi:RimJ/RimL family protein N-acetyltransferase